MTKRIAMTKKEIAQALSVPCPRCGVWIGKRCKRTDTGEKKQVPHEDRLTLAQQPMRTVANPKQAKADAAKEKPKQKLTEQQQEIVDTIMQKIAALDYHAQFVFPVSVGPRITIYRVQPLKNTRVSHLENMSKDFSVALGREVMAKRMPGESAVGITVPHREEDVKKINFRDTIQHVVEFMQEKRKQGIQAIPLNFGEDAMGKPFIEDLAPLPHLLVAGSTGGGKSTLMHGIVGSLAWVCSKEEVKLLISDTKGVEFREFHSLPHLQFPIAQSVYETMQQMQWCIEETQKRLTLIGAARVRNIQEYNSLVPKENRLPYIVFVIDELADIMGPGLDSGEAKLNSRKLSTIVARSRASGIHVIAGTQRPDVKIVSGAIKANFPARLTFRLPSQIDSRTVINTKGAEWLMSRGDMLYYSPLSSELRRLHAPYTSLQDVTAAVQFVIGREQMLEQQKHQAQNSSNVTEQKETIQ